MPAFDEYTVGDSSYAGRRVRASRAPRRLVAQWNGPRGALLALEQRAQAASYADGRQSRAAPGCW
jgi:hypothetical protein